MAELSCAAMNESHHEVVSEKIGKLHVFVKGDPSKAQVVFMTVHDLGCNHTMYHSFLYHPSMEKVLEKSCWIHVDLPGQEEQPADKRVDLDANFPTMQELGQELVCVLDALNVKSAVFGFGEGAGANILARFAILHPERVFGVILIHCTGTTAGITEKIRDEIINWKLGHGGMNDTCINYLVAHRFGSHNPNEYATKEVVKKAIADFKEELDTRINPKNLKKFIEAFLKRSDLTKQVKDLKCHVLLLHGERTSHLHTCETMEEAVSQALNPKEKKLEVVKILDTSNVLEEKPEKCAESLQYFIQGLGVAPSIPLLHQTSTGSLNFSPQKSE